MATPPLVSHLPTWEDDTISLQICHEIRWKCNKLTVEEKQVLREGIERGGHIPFEGNIIKLAVPCRNGAVHYLHSDGST